MKKIGLIGTGVMGKSMVRNLMKQGYTLSIYNRTKEKALDLIEEGAIWCDSPALCAKGQDAVITIVGYPKDVEEVYFGQQGVFRSADSGCYLIDMTTTSPKLSIKIYEAAKKRDIFALDAPVSGGDTGAQNATLSIMVGGDQPAFDACMEIFKALGSNTVYEGGAGSGQHTKMANQIAIAGTVAGVCEAMSYAKAVGLDVPTMLNSISKGAAGSWQMDNTAWRIVKGDFEPGFYIDHFIKDMGIAVEEAEDADVCLEVLPDVMEMYQELSDMGKGKLGTQALIQHYQSDDSEDE